MLRAWFVMSLIILASPQAVFAETAHEACALKGQNYFPNGAFEVISACREVAMPKTLPAAEREMVGVDICLFRAMDKEKFPTVELMGNIQDDLSGPVLFAISGYSDEKGVLQIGTARETFKKVEIEESLPQGSYKFSLSKETALATMTSEGQSGRVIYSSIIKCE